MAIFGVGSTWGNSGDQSNLFINNGYFAIGWSKNDAPDLYNIFESFKPGDIIYIKSLLGEKKKTLRVKGIGIVSKNVVNSKSKLQGYTLIDVIWKKGLQPFDIDLSKFSMKDNVRGNTIYEEFLSDIQEEIIKKLL